MEKIKNVYLSVKSVSKETLAKFITQLEENGCKVKTSELEHAEDQLVLDENEKEYIAEIIDWCDIIFVLIGDDKEENNWVNGEIEEGELKEKRIIGIYMGGNSECVPSSLEDFGEGLITNDINKIIAILNGKPSIWEDVDSTPRKPKNTIDTGDC